MKAVGSRLEGIKGAQVGNHVVCASPAKCIWHRLGHSIGPQSGFGVGEMRRKVEKPHGKLMGLRGRSAVKGDTLLASGEGHKVATKIV